VAEGVGFEPTVGLTLLSISSRVPLTTQPPFQFQRGTMSAVFGEARRNGEREMGFAYCIARCIAAEK